VSVLVTVDELAERVLPEREATLRVLDVRWRLGGPPGHEEYRAGHIPGAVYADLDSQLSAPASPSAGRHPLPDPGDVQRAARTQWGMRAGDVVVAYDDVGGLSAARAWWLLRWAGVQGVRILDGGLTAWRVAGLPLAEGDEPVEPGDIELSSGELPTMTADDVEAFVSGGGLLLDARPADRYRGSENPYDPRPGHIPGAVSAPAVEDLGPDGRFRPVRELAGRFAALGAVPGRRVGVYCGSGVTAAHLAAALALVGVDDVVLYPGSYSQWAADPNRPVAPGTSA
jgi:thiosulfate/3-mercaptopyruvate sulfurtransferase